MNYNLVSNNINKLVDENFASLSDQKYVVLEAGCGSLSHINLKQNWIKIGVDISYEQLKKNNQLNFKVLADVQEQVIKNDSVDIIICWDVLEHLENPNDAINIFLKLLKKGGFIILSVPNIESTKGIVTKYSPFYIHNLYYRYIYKSSPKSMPFKTYFKQPMHPKNLVSYLEKNNKILYSAYYVSNMINSLKHRSKLLYTIYTFCTNILVKLMSKDYYMTDFAIVVRKGV